MINGNPVMRYLNAKLAKNRQGRQENWLILPEHKYVTALGALGSSWRPWRLNSAQQRYRLNYGRSRSTFLSMKT